jgi:hypothetical protein
MLDGGDARGNPTDGSADEWAATAAGAEPDESLDETLRASLGTILDTQGPRMVVFISHEPTTQQRIEGILGRILILRDHLHLLSVEGQDDKGDNWKK